MEVRSKKLLALIWYAYTGHEEKMRDRGTQAIYVEQNSRPQLLYTEEDRPLMQEAWELISAHREDLAARYHEGVPAALVDRPPERPTVIDLLQRRPRA